MNKEWLELILGVIVKVLTLGQKGRRKKPPQEGTGWDSLME